ncbi:Tat (twin-arginine translocation) pathway signal sequence [Parafrankia irregularis]|uniref:Tat (Twin-arginine translocation) pathway signal sequence n=1 Tax=Parafrankia irregularis TaxID=795642 RepID=A0A0S4QRF2_9ACTN|nr:MULTISPECIES: sulfatase [Parafrankia]MBE3205873.1 sulfatase [Parafrankia sp. CH37]CUU58181.1 Tat (twin-arginine translocation) pathway signal sequence [Parafrankia irregularis]
MNEGNPESSGREPGSTSRRGFLAGSLAAATAAATAGLSTIPGLVSPASAATRPNILVIVTDDQPKATQWATQKTYDWIAEQGVRFTNAHCTTPLCAPSRSSIFSGRYAHNHGVRVNANPGNLGQNTTVQRYLTQAGYRTGLFGKYLNGWDINASPPHFEEWALLKPSYVDGTYNVNGTVQTINGYTTNVLRNRTLSFLDKAATDTRPWFAYVAPYAPHGPNTPAAQYADTVVPEWNGRPAVHETDKSDKPPYVQNSTSTLADGQAVRERQLRTLLSVDDAVQAFRDKLVALGQLENTLVFYVPDNGYLWGDHGRVAKSVPYTPAHELPFYVSWPGGGLGSGTVDNRIVGHIDIAPTILDAAGITPNTPQNGFSLLSSSSRDHILTEFWKKGTAAGGVPTWASYVSTTRQYVEYYDLHANASGQQAGTGQVLFREYYDLVNDPGQLVNLLYNATPAQEQALGIPALAAQLTADRAA